MGTHTQDFLEEICARHGRAPTGYAVAKIMSDRYGWSWSGAYNYRKGSTFPDDRKALDIAAELELDPMYVIACIQADRAGDPELRSLWEGLAEKAKRTAAAVILSALGGALWSPSQPATAALEAQAADATRYTLCAILQALAAAARRALEAVYPDDGLDVVA